MNHRVKISHPSSNATRHPAMEPPLPTDEQQFVNDERISFSRLDNKYIAVQDDGAEFEFNATLKRWVPASEGDVDAVTGKDTLNGAAPAPEADSGSRRKRTDDAENGAEVSAVPAPLRARHFAPGVQTIHVYVPD